MEFSDQEKRMIENMRELKYLRPTLRWFLVFLIILSLSLGLWTQSDIAGMLGLILLGFLWGNWDGAATKMLLLKLFDDRMEE